MEYYTDQEFEKLTADTFPGKGEFDNCQFEHCVLQNVDLSKCTFIDSQFLHCNLSNIQIGDTSFQNIQFKDCQMMGLHFHTSNNINFEIEFIDCQLDHSIFDQLNCKRCSFDNCRLIGVDFTEADLSGVILKNCDLSDAIFERSLLSKTDFSSAFNFVVDPDNNYLKGAVFSTNGALQLLKKYQLDIKDDFA